MNRLGFAVGCLLLIGCEPTNQPAAAPPDAATVARHNEAVAAMGAFDYGDAMEILGELTAAHPTWNDAQVDYAIAQLNRQAEGDDEAALERLAGVLDRAPSHLRAHFTSGILRLHAGEIEAAARHFEIVSKADPSDAHAAYYLGQTRMQQGDMEAAVPLFAKAIETDPYLRSAYYAGAQAARRAGQPEQAVAWLDVFQRMEHNPRAHLAEIKYTRMGRKAEIVAIGTAEGTAATRPEGPIFDRSKLGFIGCRGCDDFLNLGVGWTGEGQSLALMSTEQGSRLYRWSAKDWLQEVQAAALTRLPGVTASLWGDVNADGELDVVLLRSGTNQLWLGTGDAVFEQDDRFDVGMKGTSVDGALFDADHDGDLDVLVVNDEGTPCELINNNGDGTWQPIADEASGFPLEAEFAREVVVADFDGDLDTDVLLINQHPPHQVWLNDRLWQWRRGDEAWAPLLRAEIAAAVAADFDADGSMDIVTLDDAYGVHVWRCGGGRWESSQLASRSEEAAAIDADLKVAAAKSRPRRLAVRDVTGDGRLDVIRASGWVVTNQIGRPPVLDVLAADGAVLQSFQGDHAWTLAHGEAAAGPMMLTAGAAGGIVTIPAGSGRFPFVDFTLAGRTDPGQSMRSNASGIGAAVAARVGDRWTITGAVRSAAGPGQNLQPISIGLGGAAEVDFISIDWSDGVLQTEPHLKPGSVHVIAETQRQLSSCPVIFAWDGQKMRFLTDCLGVGGMGFLLDPYTFAPPRPRERVLLPSGSLQPRGGQFEIVLAEPMQETCYLDSVMLESIDVPPGWEVLPDERMGTAAPMPTSELLFSQRSVSPISARNGSGEDVLPAVSEVDAVAASPGVIDGRFIGRVVEPFELELQFAAPLDGRPVVLVLDGWVEYPYSQTMFAAWQAGLSYTPITIEARDVDGTWQVLHEDVGYPAGMPRTSVFPLACLPAGADALRLRTDLELYVDAVRVADIEPCHAAVVRSSPVRSAVLEQPGYPRRIDHPQRRPEYDWADRSPFWDTRVQRGEYTRLGDVRGLVSATDGGVAVFGAGEAIRCRFDPDPPLASAWTRSHVLDLRGWCKDMDLMTRQGETVEPIPGGGGGGSLRTRHRSGR
ncbi:MAG: FG-GAP-like repeat-containing protein [Phycisphaerales bacterium]|jgi:hypothetical protein|nr:FG-GAP-like repeat-containing protein [Phycisphaerales bacterium]